MKGIGCSAFTSPIISLKPGPFFSRSVRIDLCTSNLFSRACQGWTRAEIELFCFRRHDSHRCTFSNSSLILDLFDLLAPKSKSIRFDVRKEIYYKFPVMKWAADRVSELQKPVLPRALVVLTALAVVLTQPFIANTAFAATSTARASVIAAAGREFLQTGMLSSAWTGFFTGCLHTLSGPDHLAALAPLTIGRSRAESAAVGALWGCGHDAGQMIFGLFFLILKDRFHIEVLRTWGTRVVGFTLLLIGLMGMREASELLHAPCVSMENAGDDGALDTPKIRKKKMGFAMFGTGIIHGLQPDSLMMILPALSLPSRLDGAAFLLMFLVGTVVSMGGYTVFIGSCTEALRAKVPRITEKLAWISSFLAIAMGCAIFISQYLGLSLY